MRSCSGALRYFGRIKNGTTPASGEAEYWDGDVPWATPEDLGKLAGDRISQTRRQVTENAVEESNLSVLPAGSVIISTRAPIGHMAINDVPMAFNQGCRGIIPGDRVHGPFLYYTLKSRVPELNGMANGTTFVELSRDELAAVSVKLPPLDTQRRIARFLDEKTARIDGLIENKQELLGRLAEKRQALITRAVTKGLNPDVPLTPSDIGARGGERPAAEGVDGMTTVAQKARAAYGEIPEDWTRRRLRFDVVLNPNKSSLDMEPDELVSFIPMDVVGEHGGLDLDDVRELKDVYDGYTYLAEGDVCIAKITPCFENGKGALAEGLTNGVGFGTTELHVVRPGPNIDRRFLFYVSIADDFRRLGKSEMNGAAGQKRIDESFIKDWMAPLPPLDTQRQIARFLDEKTAQIDGLMERIWDSVARLEEYRSAQITAAVTGHLTEL